MVPEEGVFLSFFHGHPSHIGTAVDLSLEVSCELVHHLAVRRVSFHTPGLHFSHAPAHQSGHWEGGGMGVVLLDPNARGCNHFADAASG